METSAIGSTNALSQTATKDATSGLGGDDFFKLLIAQLTNQDPLQPTSNEELLNQISSIRDIELSTNLSDSLSHLTEQQRFSSAAALVGQFVTGAVADSAGNEQPVQGMIVAVRFNDKGQALLQLDDGSELALENVDAVMDPQEAARALTGRRVTGLDRTDPANPAVTEGVVESIRKSDDGRVMLELDGGNEVYLSDVVSVDDVASARIGV